MEEKTTNVKQETMDCFLPEARYTVTELKNWKSNPKKFIGQIVHVMPVEFVSVQGIVSVVGKNFKGIIKMREISIYPLTFFKGTKIPKCLQKIFSLYQCMTVKIIGYDEETDKFVLSRKKAMEEAIKTKRFEVGAQVEAFKTSVSHNTTFVDLGAGITAIIPVAEISSSQIENANEFFKGMDYIPVKITQNIDNRRVCSYKKAIKTRKLTEGNIV